MTAKITKIAEEHNKKLEQKDETETDEEEKKKRQLRKRKPIVVQQEEVKDQDQEDQDDQEPKPKKAKPKPKTDEIRTWTVSACCLQLSCSCSARLARRSSLKTILMRTTPQLARNVKVNQKPSNNQNQEFNVSSKLLLHLHHLKSTRSRRIA